MQSFNPARLIQSALMPVRPTVWTRVAGWLPTLSALALAVAAGGTDLRAAEVKTIKFGMTPKSFVESAQIIALQQGIFERNGLKVELVELAGDIIILRALVAGDLDIATIGSTVVLNAVEKGATIKAFVTPAPEQPHALVALKEIKTWKDLPGKVFAVSELGAISHTFPRIVLTNQGVNPDRINWLPVGGSGPRQRSLVAGKAESTLLHMERALQLTTAEPRFHIVGAMSEHLKGIPLVWHATRANWMTSNQDTIQRFTKSILEAVRFGVDNKPAMLKLGRELIGDDPKAVEAAYDLYRNSGVWGLNGGIDKRDFDATVKLAIDTKELRAPLDYDKVMEPKFVEAALKELGRR